ncbi:RNA polymerase sigma factor [Streptomyces sp. NBC_00083]|uniref:RNA polymerase sigma factor n=1 Tax=Streptomyces sp. NBC_00083 TaxID=2975647 RepID=UPI0022546527|nr:SigE family RNA polymerase sigma factor [Streptomyces sp. NBC_00083]MCX5384031.1 SigE family RNA polymerase sigma factor [Streptomyces sp. NBC_00083]
MEYTAAPHPAALFPRLRAPRWPGLLRRGRTARGGARAEPFTPGAARSGLGASGTVRDPGTAPPTVSELYHAHRLKMVHLAVMLVDDRASAEDVVQDAFTALYRRHGERIEEIDNALAYLRTAVVNASRSVLRRRRTARGYTPPHVPDAPSAEERVVLDEEHREVLAALGQLTARRREVLVLRYWSDLTEAEIATTLGISRGSVKSLASRALDSLEKILEARA